MSDLDLYLPMASVIGRAVDLLHESKSSLTAFNINESWLAHYCPRKAWYRMQGNPVVIDNHSLLQRKININRFVREGIVNDLNEIGLPVTDRGKEVVAIDGKTGLMFSGRIDGILSGLEVFNMGARPHLLATFSCGGKEEKDPRFTALVKDGFECWHLEYQVKVHVLAHLLKLTRIIVIVENKNDSQRHYERVKIDRDLAKSTIDLAFSIMKMSHPPENKKCPRCDWWEAKFCEYREECF